MRSTWISCALLKEQVLNAATIPLNRGPLFIEHFNAFTLRRVEENPSSRISLIPFQGAGLWLAVMMSAPCAPSSQTMSLAVGVGHAQRRVRASSRLNARAATDANSLPDGRVSRANNGSPFG